MVYSSIYTKDLDAQKAKSAKTSADMTKFGAIDTVSKSGRFFLQIDYLENQ